MLQEILVKRFNFKRSAYFPSVIFQKKIWNFVSKQAKIQTEREKKKREKKEEKKRKKNYL